MMHFVGMVGLEREIARLEKLAAEERARADDLESVLRRIEQSALANRWARTLAREALT